MPGFFSKQEINSLQIPSGRKYTCYGCGLYKNCESPKMQPFGNFKKKILNIGEFPGELDDRKGKQWQGKAGQYLKRVYAKFNIDLFEDCLNINAVNCRTIGEDGEDRNPTNLEVECCRKSIFNYIEQYKPKVIVLFGQIAVYSVIGHRWKKDLNSITEWRGWNIPDQDLKCWICPTFHPNYIEKSNSPEIYKVWEQDIQKIVECSERDYFPILKQPIIHYLDKLTDLPEIPNNSIIAIDYETTGLKPHDKGHRIVCAAIATSVLEAYVFMMPSNKEERKPFVDILKNRYVKKMAHNMKFEESWSLIRLGTRVKGWHWDSMLAAHILDNRSGITKLKFQTYVQFGVIDYSSHIEKWLMAIDSKNANSLNRVQEFIKTSSGKKELMEYCALDTIYEYRLALSQQNMFSNE